MTLWSLSSLLPWWKRSTFMDNRGSSSVSVMKLKASEVSCCSSSLASGQPHSARVSCRSSVWNEEAEDQQRRLRDHDGMYLNLQYRYV